MEQKLLSNTQNKSDIFLSLKVMHMIYDCTSPQSHQNSFFLHNMLCLGRKLLPQASDGSDQTAGICRLIRVALFQFCFSVALLSFCNTLSLFQEAYARNRRKAHEQFKDMESVISNLMTKFKATMVSQFTAFVLHLWPLIKMCLIFLGTHSFCMPFSCTGI